MGKPVVKDVQKKHYCFCGRVAIPVKFINKIVFQCENWHRSTRKEVTCK